MKVFDISVEDERKSLWNVFDVRIVWSRDSVIFVSVRNIGNILSVYCFEQSMLTPNPLFLYSIRNTWQSLMYTRKFLK